MASLLPPNLGQIDDHETANSLQRLFELVDRLETQLATCQVDLDAATTELARLADLEQAVARTRDDIMRTRLHVDQVVSGETA